VTERDLKTKLDEKQSVSTADEGEKMVNKN
jgi:hypothetical protein